MRAGFALRVREQSGSLVLVLSAQAREHEIHAHRAGDDVGRAVAVRVGDLQRGESRRPVADRVRGEALTAVVSLRVNAK